MLMSEKREEERRQCSSGGHFSKGIPTPNPRVHSRVKKGDCEPARLTSLLSGHTALKASSGQTGPPQQKLSLVTSTGWAHRIKPEVTTELYTHFRFNPARSPCTDKTTRWNPSNGPAAEATDHNWSLVVTGYGGLLKIVALFRLTILCQELAIIVFFEGENYERWSIDLQADAAGKTYMGAMTINEFFIT